ncbi:hypothetical protein HAX54_012956 [Datura stramonium]|uniref:RING-type E3 ubiquitin transferase n=1 Tax=Datura stramonium TaxID=4076 RepID=A0ABS8TMK4_DATST|nr:hypothetical protein [Datura stramonium]
MWTLRRFFSSPTRLSSVVMPTIGLFLYAIFPHEDEALFCAASIALHVVPVIVVVMIYEICCICQARGRRRNISFSCVINYDALNACMPLSESFYTRRRLRELRLQIALLDREIYEFRNMTNGFVPFPRVIGVPAMLVEELNALPVYNYEGTGLEREDAPMQQASSSSASPEESQMIEITEDGGSSADLICSICMDEVKKGELIRNLPCSHQFHIGCIDKWLRMNASCPICKLILGSRRRMQLVEG